MRRDDLPTSIRRELEWERKALARKVSHAYSELVDRGVDPTEFVAAVERLCREGEGHEERAAA